MVAIIFHTCISFSSPSLGSPECQGFWLHRTANRRPRRAAPAPRAAPGIQTPAGGQPVAAWRRAPRRPAAIWAAWRQQRWRGPRRPCHSSAASPARGGGGAPGRPAASETPAGPGSQPRSGWSTDGSWAPRCPPGPWWCERYPPERGCALMCPWRPWWFRPSCHPGKMRRKQKKGLKQWVHLNHSWPTMCPMFVPCFFIRKLLNVKKKIFYSLSGISLCKPVWWMMDDIKFRERKLVCFFFSNKHSLSLGIISIQSHMTEFYLIKKTDSTDVCRGSR